MEFAGADGGTRWGWRGRKIKLSFKELRSKTRGLWWGVTEISPSSLRFQRPRRLKRTMVPRSPHGCGSWYGRRRIPGKQQFSAVANDGPEYEEQQSLIIWYFIFNKKNFHFILFSIEIFVLLFFPSIYENFLPIVVADGLKVDSVAAALLVARHKPRNSRDAHETRRTRVLLLQRRNFLHESSKDCRGRVDLSEEKKI